LGIPGMHTWGAIFRKYGREIVQKRLVISIKNNTKPKRKKKKAKKKNAPLMY
jgi:hypothetical protein